MYVCEPFLVLVQLPNEHDHDVMQTDEKPNLLVINLLRSTRESLRLLASCVNNLSEEPWPAMSEKFN